VAAGERANARLQGSERRGPESGRAGAPCMTALRDGGPAPGDGAGIRPAFFRRADLAARRTSAPEKPARRACPPVDELRPTGRREEDGRPPSRDADDASRAWRPTRLCDAAADMQRRNRTRGSDRAACGGPVWRCPVLLLRCASRGVHGDVTRGEFPRARYVRATVCCARFLGCSRRRDTRRISACAIRPGDGLLRAFPRMLTATRRAANFRARGTSGRWSAACVSSGAHGDATRGEFPRARYVRAMVRAGRARAV